MFLLVSKNHRNESAVRSAVVCSIKREMMYFKTNSVIYKHKICAVTTQWLIGSQQGSKTGIEAERFSCMSFTDRQNVSDRLAHVAHLPSSGVEVKSAEVVMQWRNIYSKIVVPCIYSPPWHNSPPSRPGALVIIEALWSHSDTHHSR
jgi:hypothetical protein